MNPLEVDQSERTLTALRDEWQVLSDAIRVAQEQRSTLAVQNWEEQFEVLLREQQEIASRGQWFRGRSDLLSILDHSRWETYHSAILAWLLDPIAPHGLGASFLARILRAADPHDWTDHPQSLRVFNVVCEVARGECRADIAVFADRFTLIVENKIDAIESERQCDRIYEAFSDVTEPRFIYLTPRGRRPQSTSGAAARDFRTLSYSQVHTALKAALGATPGQATSVGRTSAVNYLHTLEEEFL